MNKFLLLIIISITSFPAFSVDFTNYTKEFLYQDRKTRGLEDNRVLFEVDDSIDYWNTELILAKSRCKSLRNGCPAMELAKARIHDDSLHRLQLLIAKRIKIVMVPLKSPEVYVSKFGVATTNAYIRAKFKEAQDEMSKDLDEIADLTEADLRLIKATWDIWNDKLTDAFKAAEPFL